MKKIVIITLLIFQTAWAISQPSVGGINVFTGTNYVNLLIEVKDISGPVSIYTDIHNKAGEMWSGERKGNIIERDGHRYVNLIIRNLSPDLWTPATPVLYDLDLKIKQKRKGITEKKLRIGFRSFESKGGRIYLNGKPVFLRGIAINPPGRGIPSDIERSKQFAYDYIRFMKSIHVNIIRIPDDEIWYEACDELGMMVFGGNYSGSVNGQKPPEDYKSAIKWYRTEKFNAISNHPALMIYAITNETPFHGSKAQPWEDFTKFAHAKLRDEWDSTRLYIGNAGYGYGKSGDICDLHRYWGWYYSSPFTFLTIRDNKKIIPFDKPVQPITFTESVGNYTGPDGRYNLTPDHKNPVSQLAWTGHAPQDRQASLASEHQVFTFKQATELFRRLRNINPELSGIFPFTILFHNWNTITRFTDMEPKEVAFQAKTSYSPILLSWEIWTPNVYAGSQYPVRFHVVNDSDDFSDLKGATVSYELTDDSGKVFFSGTSALPDIDYYDTYTQAIQIKLPSIMPSGTYHMNGTITKDDEEITTNSYDFFVANITITANREEGKNILLFDPQGDTGKGLHELGIKFNKITDLNIIPNQSVLIIGKNALESGASYSTIQKYIKSGGRALVLSQSPEEFDALNRLVPVQLRKVVMDIDNATYPPPERPSRNGLNVNPERPGHPVFAGLKRKNFKKWSDYTDWNEQKSGMHMIYPVRDGFALKDNKATENIAVLADYSIGLEGLALIEVFQGKGSYLISGFDIVNRIGKDPVADKLLVNMINYMRTDQGHYAHPLIQTRISWGQYGSEKGLLAGIYSGFMLNSKPLLEGSYKDIPLVVTKEGHLLAGGRGGWNTRPGIQYVPYGRRAFGPYYHRGFGGVPEAYNYDSAGTAEFWCRVEDHVKVMNSLVWNPSSSPLIVRVVINGEKVEQEIGPEKEAWLHNQFNPLENNHIIYQADRRIVFLETVFD